MADDNIVIAVTDKVPTTVAKKFLDIGDNARTAQKSIDNLQATLNRLSVGNLNSVLGQATSATGTLNTSVQALSAQFTQLGQQISQINSGLNGISTNSNTVVNNITNITNATSGLNTGLINLAAGFQVFNQIKSWIDKAVGSIEAMVQVQAGLDRFNIGMKTISDNATAAAANTQFVTDLVNKLGLSLDATQQSFIKFASATKGTNLQGEQTQQIFEGIADAAAVLHLTASQTQSVFLALEQMASKGTVSMEELRRQLANNLPGALEIAAQAMGVTTGQLQDMVSKGQVAASDFLPKFAAAVKEHYADAVNDASDSAQASINRFGNAWEQLTRSIADSGVGKAAANQLNILTDAMNGITEAMQRAKQQGAGFFGQAAAGVGGALSFLNPVNFVSYQAQSIDGLKKQISQWQAELQTSSDFYKSHQLAFNIANAQKKLTDLQNQGPAQLTAGAQAALTNLDPAKQAANLQQENQAAIDKFLNSGKHMTRAETLQKNLADIDNQFKQATAHLQAGSDLYNQALAAATARKQALQDAYDKAGISKAHHQEQNELSAQITQLQGYAEQRKQIFDTDLQNLTTNRNNGLLTEKQYIQAVGDARDKELTDLQAIAEKQADLAAGKDQLSARQRFIAEANKLGEQLVTNAQSVQTQLSALDQKTTQTAQAQLLSLQQAGANRANQNAISLAGVGMSSQQQQEANLLNQITQRANQARLALTQQATKLGTLGDDSYVKGLQAISDEEQTQLAQEKQYFADRTTLQSNWLNGAIAGFNTFLDSARNVAGQTQQLFTQSFDTLNDKLANFVTTGKIEFGDLVNSILTGVIKMELQSAESKFLPSLFGAISSAGGAAAAGFASGGYTGNGGVNQVAGVVHGQEYVVPANVVKQPGVLDMLETMTAGYKTGGYVGIPQGSPSRNPAMTGGLTVNITNNAADQVAITAKQSTDSAGNPTLEVMANLLEGQMAGKVAQGRGKLHDAIQSKFGVRSIPGQGA